MEIMYVNKSNIELTTTAFYGDVLDLMNMGVDIDQLTAQLATIIATTRQAPETVGNALKTIYTRINDIKAGTDEAEMRFAKKLRKMGIDDELLKMGIEEGDKVRILDTEFEFK